MKNVGIGLLFSLGLHLIYLFNSAIVGFIKTWNYKPEMDKDFGNVQPLSEEIAFGSTGSSLFFIISFIGMALLFTLIIYCYQKLNREGKPLS